MRYAIYDTTTGAISKVVECSEDLLPSNTGEGEASLEILDQDLDVYGCYVDAALAVFKEKQPMGFSLEQDGLQCTLVGVPPGTDVLLVEAGRLTADNEDIELYFDAPGKYELCLYPPPQYRDEVLEVTVG